MQHITSPDGTRVSYDVYGAGPPLVLVHGSFNDHRTNWEFVKPFFEKQFTVYALARRGGTDATKGHTVEDESRDVSALIDSIEEPVFLLGHSYGAQVALGAAANILDRVRKLVLYEPPWPSTIRSDTLARLEELAQVGNWNELPATLFQETFSIPMQELEELRATEHWPLIVADAEASLEQLRALSRYIFSAERFHGLHVPVLLQVGTESPRDKFVTDTLAAVLPDARVEASPGQAHEGITMAPEQYAASVFRFLAPLKA
ncbi:pimeloyl-ACP methyl ester carboxylesterase [Natronocella acetinitrilica]|uniref:Pimeloyl-ACP methyl ester carboxylesterase n=1 Tax=Natronocella acetinitrilica TaxID=414046 RepID=A0AAE3G919_9GAMM|nr:alpha/beta hydrolase [Natronocella acetinitrilica]MCP1677051.1 pimeloyl-ACP methyl ester carboxylesterase [Natronocella acetinitrilica]